MKPSSLEQSRQFAAEEVGRLLGCELEPGALFELAAGVLGRGRAERCLHITRFAALSRRSMVTSAVAELIVGTQELGLEWWSRARPTVVSENSRDESIPDAVLNAPDPTSDSAAESRARTLAGWIADDAADARWGPSVGYIDLNDPRAAAHLKLPADAKAGERLVYSFDPGGRAWVDVVEREPADDAANERASSRPLTARLVNHEYNDVAAAGWAWGIAIYTGPLRLPGEVAGEPTDPFASPVNVALARDLRDWSIELGADADTVRGDWRTKRAISGRPAFDSACRTNDQGPG